MQCGLISCKAPSPCVKIYILRFSRSIVDRQTWSDDGSASERRLRSKVLSLACHLEDPPCLERAKRSFKDWLRSNGTLGYVRLNPNATRRSCSLRDVSSYRSCASLLVFTLACQPTWRRPCFRSELGTPAAGRRSSTRTTSPSLQHRKAKSCVP